MKTIPPLRSFRVYPEWPSRLHYVVRVFGTVQGLRRYGRKSFGSPAHKALGWCGSYSVVNYAKKGAPGRMRPLCGEILFAKRHLRNSVISHECAHAALGYMRRRRQEVTALKTSKEVGPQEERFCHALSDMVAQTVSRLYQYELLK